MIRLLLLSALLVGLNGCGPAKSLAVDVLGYSEASLDEANVRRDLAYLPDGDPKHRLNLFLPLADSVRATPWPVVMFVHGGGWTEGDRDFSFGGEDFYNNVGRYLAGHGIGTAVISYRLPPTTDWRSQVADVAAALSSNIRMIRRIAEIYGGRSGTLGSWRLTRAVMSHLVATGAVAVGDDMLEPILGGGLLGKLSRRFGEGLVNGALTARVGVAAMEVCRPLPFRQKARPSVREIIRTSLTGLVRSSDKG